MNRRFTLSEAESLLPEVDRLIREAVKQKQAYDAANSALQQLNARAALLGGIVVDRPAALENRLARQHSAECLKSAMEAIEQVGCVVKDLDIGLVDFPTLFRGKEVYLCWKMGEPGIRFWHGVDEGFAGRKPIDQDFLDNHRGDQPH